MRSSLMTSAALAAALAFAAPAMAQSSTTPEPSAKPSATDTMERSATPSDSSTAAPSAADSASGAATGDTAATSGDSAAGDSMAGGGMQAAAIPPEDLKGMPVHDAAGEKIGEVEDVRTGSGGDIERLIVSQGGFMGLGAKKVAIDGQQAQVQSDRVTLDMTGAQVAELPDYEDPSETAEQPAATPAEPATPPASRPAD